MSLSGLLRAAWIAVPAALVCSGAVAQQVITVPPDVTVIVSPGQPPVLSDTSQDPVLVEAAPPSAIPIERIFAEQRAMMDRMIADMGAMFAPMPNQTRMFDVAAQALAAAPTNRGTFCSESVSITYNGRNTAPLVKVSRAGSGCGPAAGGAPVPTHAAPQEQRQPNVIEITSPAAAARHAVRHHT